jgi:hypothetical protein
MKKGLLIILGMMLVMPLFSQNDQTEEELVLSYFKLEKKALVSQAMNLSDVQAEIFWPVYNAYEQETAKLTQMRIAYLKVYAEKYETITPEEADAIMKKAFEYQKKHLALEVKYYKILKKKLGALVATRFIQVEEYINTGVKMQLLDAIPFVD